MKNNSAMTTHIHKTIGYSAEQLLSYFIDNNFDLDSAHDFFNECERKAASLENELQALDLGAYNYDDDSYENEREEAELQHEIEDYQELAAASEDAYTLLDNYLAGLQVDYAMLMSEC